ncbi:MAG: dehydrogenase subunit [Symbiobacteriaceae bacterium]|jgi:NADH:ubiquinone oxidoreductase subunit F (NADH-binding)|nr:dehydrogenase subunit [Symbiobacteriaceae bacterium]
MTPLLTEPGRVTRESLAEYREAGGYRGLAEARARVDGRAWVLGQVRRAGLRGRGGSGEGRPVAATWARVARATSPVRYVIANGAETSPASRKDRHLLSLYPHRVLEGLLIAAHAVGAAEVFLYIRNDADEALASAEAALGEARAAGLLEGVAVRVQPAAPSAVVGEASAVVDALEGLEGLPQPKSAPLESIGLRGEPTVVTNVETLAAAAGVLRLGPEQFLAQGVADCPGTALFTVSGDVAAPGVYEVAYGTPLRELLRMAGAPPAGELLAVLPGGLGSGPLRPDELDVRLTYEALIEIGSSLGPAAVVVIALDRTTLPNLAAETSAYLAAGSCGQCNGCRESLGQVAQAFGAGDPGRARQWAEVALYGRGNCAHPTGAARFALRLLQAFPEVWSK